MKSARQIATEIRCACGKRKRPEQYVCDACFKACQEGIRRFFDLKRQTRKTSSVEPVNGRSAAQGAAKE
jgi:hypothetical protein